jgi:hypothetical protein
MRHGRWAPREVLRYLESRMWSAKSVAMRRLWQEACTTSARRSGRDCAPPPPTTTSALTPRSHEMSTLKTSAAVLDLEFSPYEPELLVATLATGEIVLYRVRRGRYTLTQLSSHMLAENSAVHQLTFSPSIRGLAVAAAADGMVYFVRITGFPRADGAVKPVRTLRAADAAVLRATFSADGKSLFTGGADGAVAEWRVKDLDNIQRKWRDDTCSRGITTVVPWPAPFASDVGLKRRLLLTGAHDGAMRVLDLSSQLRPPYCRQELELHGTVWRLAPLPPLPDGREVEKLGAGSFCAAVHPEVTLDPELQGMLAAAGEGGGRVLIHKQKFEEVFLPRRDGSDIVDWTTSDGVLMDHEGREKQYYWYDLADIEEHGDSRVMAADATAVIDYDPLFKDAGKQRLRRGWRLVTASRDGTMCFWQVYVE